MNFQSGTSILSAENELSELKRHTSTVWVHFVLRKGSVWWWLKILDSTVLIWVREQLHFINLYLIIHKQAGSNFNY